jgi:hypothetical protein
MAAPLAQRGVEVFNASPHSALRCFPFRPFEDIMAEEDEGRLLRGHAADAVADRVIEQGDDDGAVTWLQRIAFRDVEREIARLARAGDCRVIIDRRDPVAALRRPPGWWAGKLRCAFAAVIVESVDGDRAVFDCRAG